MVDAPLTRWLDQVSRKHKLGPDAGAQEPSDKVGSSSGGDELTADERQRILDDLRQMDKTLDGLLAEAKKTG